LTSLDAAAFAQRVDEAGIAVCIADRAQRRVVAKRHVDRALEMPADITAVDDG
jgi:hypothetical protein